MIWDYRLLIRIVFIFSPLSNPKLTKLCNLDKHGILSERTSYLNSSKNVTCFLEDENLQSTQADVASKFQFYFIENVSNQNKKSISGQNIHSHLYALYPD